MPTDLTPRLIGQLAAPQDGCVTRRQILSAGVTARRLDGLRSRGFLTAVFPGVYLVGPPTLSHRAFLRASVLHAGPDAFPSHRTGLELRALLPARLGRATVTTPRSNVASPVRTRMRLESGGHGFVVIARSIRPKRVPVETVDGFETSLLPRTFIDAASSISADLLRRAWKEAEFRCVLDAAAIRAELDADHRRSGSAAVRERLENAYPLTRPGMDVRSRKGELLFLELVREAGLPEPLVNVPMVIGGVAWVADFYWPDLRLVIEVDGPQHSGDEQVQADKVRDIDFFNAELDLLRFTTQRMRTHRSWCVRSLQEALARQARRAS